MTLYLANNRFLTVCALNWWGDFRGEISNFIQFLFFTRIPFTHAFSQINQKPRDIYSLEILTLPYKNKHCVSSWKYFRYCHNGIQAIFYIFQVSGK